MSELGERGPQGDHGQDGKQGERGERGHSNWIPWIAAIIAFVSMGIVLTHHIEELNIIAADNKTNIMQLKETTAELKETKVNIIQLQHSNCVIKTSVLEARTKAYQKSIKQGHTIKEALASVATLTTIIKGLDGDSYCPIPKKYELPKA